MNGYCIIGRLPSPTNNTNEYKPFASLYDPVTAMRTEFQEDWMINTSYVCIYMTHPICGFKVRDVAILIPFLRNSFIDVLL